MLVTAQLKGAKASDCKSSGCPNPYGLLAKGKTACADTASPAAAQPRSCSAAPLLPARELDAALPLPQALRRTF